jgi:hypothetical protein
MIQLERDTKNDYNFTVYILLLKLVGIIDKIITFLIVCRDCGARLVNELIYENPQMSKIWCSAFPRGYQNFKSHDFTVRMFIFPGEWP